MIGLVVASHGRFAEELVATARQIVGELDGVVTSSVEPSMSGDELKQQIKEAVRSVDTGQGVIVFADLIGGSPCMQSLSLCQQIRLEVITGVNLPMLIKANSLRKTELTLHELALQLTDYGRRNITCASEALRAKSSAA
jgi:PTS system mannose-specific IIA component